MNLGKLTNIVQCVIKSRKDKTNKITQLAMAINGTYVEDTAYVDDKIQWMIEENEGEVFVQHSNISKAVEKINSLESENIGLLLTEKQASKFSILAGLAGVEILDLSQKDVYDSYASHFAALGVDITGIVLMVAFAIGELDNNTKFTYNGVEYTLLPAEEEPVVTAPVFDSVDQIGETFSSSQFQLGDNIVYNATDNALISPYVIFLTAEQYSKFQITGTFVDNETQQTFENEILSACLGPVSNFGEVPFTIPQNAAYACLLCNIVAEAIGAAIATSITVTYDGVDYVYDNTNVQITLPEEEPTAPVFNCTNRNDGTVTVSTFQLGDNCVYTDSVVTPEMIFLTSEQYNNLQISATIANDADQSVAESLSAHTTPISISVLTNPDFQVPQDAAYIVPFADLIAMIPDALESVTFTYDGTNYVYTIDKITTTTIEQQGE